MGLPLEDRFGRVHTYLRVSVTDRCNYRCVYCMPAEGLTLRPRKDLLSYEEIGRLAHVFRNLGIERIRLTGGEPTVRSDIVALVQAIRQAGPFRDIAMTTNGHLLAKLAHPLADAGLTRVNVSLDSLDAESFARMSRGGDLGRVLAGIDAAHDAGLTPIKLNAVVLAGENDGEVEALVQYAAQRADTMEIRFIEYMPFEERWHQGVPSRVLRERLGQRWTLEPVQARAGAGPARHWRVAELGVVVGFIAPLSEHFCATCNRLRLQTDGHLRTCLAHEDTPSLRDLLRGGASDAELEQAIRRMVLGKPEGHDCQTEGGVPFQGVMTGIGG